MRSIATKLNLVTADKKDSQGLCFIGKVSLPDFLMQQLAPKEGRVIEIDRTHPSVLEYETQISQEGNADSALLRLALNPEMGVEIGVHRGAHFYTRGQRRGLNIGGKYYPFLSFKHRWLIISFMWVKGRPSGFGLPRLENQ